VNNQNGTVNLLSSLLEIFATARSALATYAVCMAVTNGDQTFSVFTTAVVEGALILSMMSIGFDAVSPITAIVSLIFSAVMQYVEVITLTGVLSANDKQTLNLVLSFAPSVLLGLGILRRLSGGVDGFGGLLDSLGGFFGGLFPQNENKKGSRAYGYDVELPKRKSKRPFHPGSKRAR
jgi:hypothetical protein